MLYERVHLSYLLLPRLVVNERYVAPLMTPHHVLHYHWERVEQLAGQAGQGRELCLVVQQGGPRVGGYDGDVPVTRHVAESLDRRAACWEKRKDDNV